ncbi:hypothetical protein QAD02_014202 [Eretmocerus hayati]|uniref:Uncharacterized protein n=1 Tax=Eretmocerus hayati TaxID=131215 RepID=A0ACC2P499_9HYME|nr:hypothetical protein QAD02_014202 [Eretmocerus hayati]
MAYMVDVQGFKSPTLDFVFKEVAILSTVEGAQHRVYLFKPPHDWNLLTTKYKSENRWLEKNYIGIPWSYGNIPYEDLAATIQDVSKDSTRVFVKGKERKKWLENIISHVEDLEDYGSPSISKLCGDITGYCSHHTLCMSERCAVQNVYSIKKWMGFNRARTSTDVDTVDSMYT